MRLPILPTLVVTLAVATMIALGIWQLDRRGEKNAIIARFAANVDRPVISLPPDPEAALFRRVRARCADPGEWRAEAGRAADGTTGFRHIVRCRDHAVLYVEAGVSTDPAVRPEWAGGAVTGTLTRAPDGTSILGRLVGNRGTPGAMIVAETPAPGLLPSRRPDPSSVPNNHLAYAIQWFAFAGMATVIYLLALRRRGR